MDIKTKHRIIGIIVIIGLAIIITPFLFSRAPKSGGKTPSLSSDVPAAPDTKLPLTIPPDQTAQQNKNQTKADLATQALQPTIVQPTPAQAPIPIAANTIKNTNIAASETAVAQPVQKVDEVNQPQSFQNASQTLSNTSATTNATDIKNTANHTFKEPKLTKLVPIKPTHMHHKRAIQEKKIYAKHAPQKTLKKKIAVHKKLAKIIATEGAWTIQLGSFAEKKNAEKLVKKLRAKGFSAYLHVAKTNETYNRVYVGPELKRKKAEDVIKRLYAEFQLQGVVVKYEV